MQRLVKSSLNLSTSVLKGSFLTKVRKFGKIQFLSVTFDSIFIFCYQLGLPCISSGLLSNGVLRHRGISNLSTTEEKLVLNAVVKKIEPTEQGPLMLVDQESSKNGNLPIKVRKKNWCYIGEYVDGL